jgi:hypothetical protein
MTIVKPDEDFPDYVFFDGYGSDAERSWSVTIHFFAPGTTVRRVASRTARCEGMLYGVPRAEADNLPGWKEAAEAAKLNPHKYLTVSVSGEEWLALGEAVRRGKIPGGISIPFGNWVRLLKSDERELVTQTYRIVRTPAGVAFVEVESDTTGPRKNTRWGWIAVGGVGSAATLLGGLWLVRRGARRVPPPPPPACVIEEPK